MVPRPAAVAIDGPARRAGRRHRRTAGRRSADARWLLAVTLSLLAAAPQLATTGPADPADRADPADPADRAELIVRLRPAGPAGIAPSRQRVTTLLADLHPGWRPAFRGHRAETAGQRPGDDPGSAAAAVSPAAGLRHIQVLTFATGADRDAAAARLVAHPEVVYIEPVRAFDVWTAVEPAAGEAAAAAGGGIEPGDELFPEQWALPKIGMPEAWKGGTTTGQVIVGVVDTGIDLEHPDLTPNLTLNAAERGGSAGVDDDQNGFVDDIYGWDFMADAADPDDGHGHGSHVAGIIGAASDGAFGTVGVTWEVGLLAAKMFDDHGVGTNLSGAQGIVYAVDRGCDIINMSWGTPNDSRVIRDAIEHAVAAGVVLVASAGNDSASPLEAFPAASDDVITVGASDTLDRLAGFSNRGAGLDLIAPGVRILSTRSHANGFHLENSGTSQAAPHVAGVAAHVLHRHPGFTPRQVRAAIVSTAVDLGRTGWDSIHGAGRLLAAAAIAVEATPVAVIRTPSTLDAFAGGTVVVRADVLGDGATGVLALGRGVDPTDWTRLWEGPAGADRALATLDVATLDDDSYTLQLVVSPPAGLDVEDRVVFRVDRSTPVLIGAEPVQLLEAARLRQQVRVVVDERVRLRAHVRERGDAGPFEELIVDDFDTMHILDFGGRLPGVYEFSLMLVDRAGNEIRVPEDGSLFARSILPTIDIPSDLLVESARIAGFELGALVDLDGDGRPELLGELRGPDAESGALGRLAGDRVAAGELPDDTGLHGLPLDHGDLDGDGTREILVAGAEGSGRDGGTEFTIYSWPAAAAPRAVARWFDASRRFGGGLADVDSDGRDEILYAENDRAALKLLDDRGGTLEPVELGFESPVPRTAGFAVDDLDGDGLTEIVLGTLSGDVLVLEHDGGGGYLETFREPLRGGLANAIVVTGMDDADGDGAPEFVISTVGVISAREQRPSVVVFEADGDDSYSQSAWFQLRDKNNPFDNALEGADVDGDGRPELLVAMASDVYLFEAAGDDRYVPIWHAPRSPGGRLFVADLDLDERPEVLVTEQSDSGPVTVVYTARLDERPLALGWFVRRRADGVQVGWLAPSPGSRVFDLAIYRLDERPSGRLIESDLAERRIHAQRGEVPGAGSYLDRGTGSDGATYLLAYTVEDADGRRRVLAPGRTPPAASESAALVIGRAHPSPFLASTSLSVELARSAAVELRVYDVTGRLLRLVPAATLAAGANLVTWDGLDGNGRQAAAGIYFMEIDSPVGRGVRKVVRLR